MEFSADRSSAPSRAGGGGYSSNIKAEVSRGGFVKHKKFPKYIPCLGKRRNARRLDIKPFISICYRTNSRFRRSYMSQLIFIFLLFLGMVMYANELKQRKKINWNKKINCKIYLEYKQYFSFKSNQSCRQYRVDRLTRNYIPCLAHRGQKPYPVQRHIPV